MTTTINSTSITTNTISGGIDIVTDGDFNNFHGLKSYTIITQTGSSTYTKPSGGTVQTYIRCRKTGETTERGELSKTYYDEQ